MSLTYALQEIRRHGTDPTWWRKRFLTHVVSRYYDLRPHDATPVTEREWDTLVILDACRHDLFREVFDDRALPGTLDSRTAVETGTPGFLAETFGDRQVHDIVYVTGNPYVSTDLEAEQFHAVDEVWRDGWDDELGTVHPETMRDRTLAATETYPRKRIISHFLQPHAPFVGETHLPGDRETFAIRERAMGDQDATRSVRTPFERLEAGELTHEEVWTAYRSNLEFAFPAVRNLLEELDGLTAVTSDHGNALGERALPFPIRVYGHPLGVLIPALTEVPWLTHQNGDRREVVADPPERRERDVAEETAARLRQLGYAE
jgi:hypothetical protein